MTKAKKHKIQVRKYEPGQTKNGSDSIGKITGNFGKHSVVETISRVPKAESIGNFNPVFCTYKKKEHLVHSDEGDLSDPFRADKSYLATLFIQI